MRLVLAGFEPRGCVGVMTRLSAVTNNPPYRSPGSRIGWRPTGNPRGSILRVVKFLLRVLRAIETAAKPPDYVVQFGPAYQRGVLFFFPPDCSFEALGTKSLRASVDSVCDAGVSVENGVVDWCIPESVSEPLGSI